MGVSYRPENPFAQGRKYRRENPFADESSVPQETQPSDLMNKVTASRASQGLPPEKGNIKGNVYNAVNSALFGFGDELAGAMAGGWAGEGGYEKVRDHVRGEIKALPKGERLVSSIVGGAVPALLTGGASAAPTTLGKAIAQTTGTGAVAGGLYGAGEAEGGLKERAEGAGWGAVIGGLTGAAAQTLGGAASKLAQRFKRAPQDRATQLMTRAIEQGGQSIDDIEKAALATNKPTMMVDLMGKPGANLARNAGAFETKGGTALGDALEGRMRDQPTRIADDLATAANITQVNSREAIERLAAERDAMAKPLYDAVRDIKVTSPQLRTLFSLPDVQRSYRIAEAVAANRAATGQGSRLPPLSSLIEPPQPKTSGLLDARGNPMPSAQVEPQFSMTVGTLDQVKRGLDDVLYLGKKSGSEAGGMGPTEIKSLEDVKNALIAIGDEAATIPGTNRSGYAEARAVWQGPTKLIEQLEEASGTFLKPSVKASDVAKDMAALSSAEREAYKAGALEAISTRAGQTKSGRDATAFLDSPEMQSKVRALFDDDASFAEWVTRFRQEVGFGQTRNTVGVGSRTTPMAIGAGEIANPGAAMSALSGNFGPLLREAATRLVARGRHQIGTQTADALATRMSAGRGGRQEIVAELERLRKGVPPTLVKPLAPSIRALLGGGQRP